MGIGQRGLVGLGLAALVAGSFTAAGTRDAKAGSAPIGFSAPMVMDPIETVGEPTIVHSPASDNTVYASGPWGTGTQRSIWNASADGGETFRLVQQCAPQSGEVAKVCPPPTAVQGTPNPPGGGDTDQRLDHTGKDYFVDLWALACDRVATTTDHGATAVQNAYGCNSPTVIPASRPDGSDRQWLAAFDPALTGVKSTAPDAATAPLMYMEYNNLQTIQTNPAYWVRSIDGINYTPVNNDNGNVGSDGYPAVDQITGKVFEATDGGNNTLVLNIGTPIDASGDLCFLDDTATITIGGNLVSCPAADRTGLITVASGLAGSPTLLFTVASMDKGRNLHITYAVSGSVSGTTSTYQVFTTVASAATGWTKWATPVQISQAPANVNVFPWMVAGGPGRSDSVWYGTSTFSDPSTLSTPPQAWNVYMSQAVWPVDSSGGVTLAPPTTTMVRVTPHPMHYGTICLLGTGCITVQGDRNLADFFTVTLDHNGAAQVEYDDTSNGLIQPGFTPASGLADHPGAPVVTIAQQNSGPGLLGTSVSGLANEPKASTSGMSDRSGDALYPVIGGANQPAFDFTANRVALSAGGVLTVTMKVADVSPSTIAADARNVTGTAFLQYVTRWQMGNTIYYAMAETTPGSPSQFQFYAGKAQSIDLCSVSACDPHVIEYPEAPATGANSETGSVSCPTTPSQKSPCTITVNVKAVDVGGATQSSLLEEIGSYSFGSAHPQAGVTNNMAELDELPLEIDGVCCFNFGTTARPGTSQASAAPELLGVGTLLVAAGTVRRRRRNSDKESRAAAIR